MKRNKIVLLSVAGVMFAIACSSSSDPPAEDYTGSCSILASQCHPYKTGLGHECHELGHGGDDKACGPRKAECQAACPIVEASTPEDSGTPDVDPGDASTDTGTDAAPDPVCTTYCQCLTDTCATQTGYPFTAAGSCLAACAKMSAPEKKCWPGFCEQAKNGVSKEHNCEHAWGNFNLDECPP